LGADLQDYDLILVDSSGWIEYLANRPLARRHRARLVTADQDFEGLPDTIVVH